MVEGPYSDPGALVLRLFRFQPALLISCLARKGNLDQHPVLYLSEATEPHQSRGTLIISYQVSNLRVWTLAHE